MSGLVVAGINIRRDAEGRYCLNDLHRAAGGEKRHGPSYWLANAQTHELIAELSDAGNPVTPLQGDSGNPLSVQRGGTEQGTYAAKELVYAYAMWISAAFHLKVIRSYDALVTAPALPNFNDPVAAARAWADAAERERQASEALAVAAPKAQALDRIAAADGSLSVTDAAKVLQAKPADLFGWLHVHGWIFRRGGKGAWRARQEKLDAGLLMHKAMVVTVAGRRAVRAQRRLRRLRTVAPPLLDTAGERIRYARVTMGLSQAQFADAVSRESGCRITKAAVSKWENNLTGLPQAENLLAVERVTGYPVDWLVRGGPEPERLGEVSDTDRLVEAVHVTPAGLAALAGLLGADVRQMALLVHA